MAEEPVEKTESTPKAAPAKKKKRMGVAARCYLATALLILGGFLFLALRDAKAKADYAARAAAAAELWRQHEEFVTPAPTETPAPTPTPSPVPTEEPPLNEQITDEMLNGAARPRDDAWYESARPGFVAHEGMIAVRFGPGLAWKERTVLRHNDEVTILAAQDGWTFLRIADGRLGWVGTTLVAEK